MLHHSRPHGGAPESISGGSQGPRLCGGSPGKEQTGRVGKCERGEDWIA